MQVIPAIDIKGGKVVRLEQGAADKVKVYPFSPVEMAMKFEAAGASLIHVVDLDGAFGLRMRNLGIVREMARSVKAMIELGGGIKDEYDIRSCFDAGIRKVVIGTRALDEEFIADIVDKFGERIVVGIDARAGIVHTKGWVLKTKVSAVDLLKKMECAGVRTVNYTDIFRDGMLEGPDIGSLKAMLGVTGIDIIASGGITNIGNVKRLKALERDGLKGMIIGKAIYEGRIDLGEAIKIAE